MEFTSACQHDDARDQRSTDAERNALGSLVRGLKGGFVATLVMTAFRLPISKSPPPTGRFWAKYVAGGDPDEHPVPAAILHLAYGMVGGAVCASIWTPNEEWPAAAREAAGILWGLAYSAPLSVFGTRVVLKRVLDVDLEADEALIFHVGHAVYGLTLGAYLGSNA